MSATRDQLARIRDLLDPTTGALLDRVIHQLDQDEEQNSH